MTTYTSHDYRMMAKAAGYEIEIHPEFSEPASKKVGSSSVVWNPTQGQDFINLIADAGICINWSPARDLILASVWHKRMLDTDYIKVSGHPSPTAAMIAAGLSCAIAKGLAMQKAEAIDHDR